MELTHFGHSCLLAELNGQRILFDPGTFSHGFEGITDLAAILVTHQHPDHVDTARLPELLAQNPKAARYADPQTAAQLGDGWTAVNVDDEFAIGDLTVRGVGGDHAVIHPDLPMIDNIGYLVGTEGDSAALFHPGDALYRPQVDVDVLALPAMAPWMKIAEAIDYLRDVAPRLAVPIHNGLLKDESLGVFYGRFTDMADPRTEFRTLDIEQGLTV